MSIEIDLTFWQYLLVVVFVLGVGFVAGRILGIHRGFLRATAARRGPGRQLGRDRVILGCDTSCGNGGYR
ncbi:MAG TPA: hypothetical protein VIC62_05940 [Nakamurella sp.]|jgi:hypothetical protein